MLQFDSSELYERAYKQKLQFRFTVQGPRRLVGIHIQSLSLAEFACAPQLSPTSMYLTVPKGKNVSIVCRVASDPVSTITWFFNGQQIHSSDNDDALHLVSN